MTVLRPNTFRLLALLPLLMPGPALAGDVEALIALWSGSYDTARQVQAHAPLGDGLPGQVDERRTLSVTPLPDSALGSGVVLLEERRAGEATVHRQRLHRIVETDQGLRVQQLFFRDGPVYDRPPAELSDLSRLGSDDVEHVARCDLHLSATEAGFRGGMTPRSCTYDHPRGGEVWAEFDMVLSVEGYAYRDRSVLVETGAAKGEIADFGWLRFDRVERGRLDPEAFPALSRQLGTWVGEFQRTGPDGEALERFPTRIVAELLPDGTYRQSNTYRPGTDAEHIIRSTGRVEGFHLVFENDRVRGKARDIDADTSVFLFDLADGTRVREIVSLSPDGRTRHRATQYLKDDVLVRRTLITEEKVED